MCACVQKAGSAGTAPRRGCSRFPSATSIARRPQLVNAGPAASRCAAAQSPSLVVARGDADLRGGRSARQAQLKATTRHSWPSSKAMHSRSHPAVPVTARQSRPSCEATARRRSLPNRAMIAEWSDPLRLLTLLRHQSNQQRLRRLALRRWRQLVAWGRSLQMLTTTAASGSAWRLGGGCGLRRTRRCPRLLRFAWLGGPGVAAS